ncbi:MAG: tyrosine-type recombinase/integrase [Microcystis panniformis]
MKRDRNGQAKILSEEEVAAIFNLLNPRDRAIFAICLFCGCRISEALSIRAGDIGNGIITIRKANTKGKKAVDRCLSLLTLKKFLMTTLRPLPRTSTFSPAEQGTSP